MHALPKVRRWSTVGWWVMAAVSSGCAAGLPTPDTANRYQVGRWQGLDADDAGRALKRRLNTPPSAPARPVEHAVVPIMPATAIAADMTGAVDVQWRIGRDGTVRDATVSGTPPLPLAKAALAAVRQWRFAPGATDHCCITQRFEFLILDSNLHPNGADAASQ